jgi:cell fate regulator YaaT (PSP1 superfamily)
MQDELKALQLCQGKVRAKKLPMEVVDAEYQWYGYLFLSLPFLRILTVMPSGTDENSRSILLLRRG